MSSNSSSRNAAQRERERRAAAKAKRQAAKATGDQPVVDTTYRVIEDDYAELPAKTNNQQKPRRTNAVVAPDAGVLPLGDQQGDVAVWMMLGIVFLLALLVVAVVFAA